DNRDKTKKKSFRPARYDRHGTPMDGVRFLTSCHHQPGTNKISPASMVTTYFETLPNIGYDRRCSLSYRSELIGEQTIDELLFLPIVGYMAKESSGATKSHCLRPYNM